MVISQKKEKNRAGILKRNKIKELCVFRATGLSTPKKQKNHYH